MANNIKYKEMRPNTKQITISIKGHNTSKRGNQLIKLHNQTQMVTTYMLMTTKILNTYNEENLEETTTKRQ